MLLTDYFSRNDESLLQGTQMKILKIMRIFKNFQGSSIHPAELTDSMKTSATT